MNERKPIRASVMPTSVVLAMALAVAALWLSPNDPDRTGDPRGGGGQAERPSRGIEKFKKIWSRIVSGESWTFGRKPVWEPLVRALPRTLRVNLPGLLAGWAAGFLLGCWAGSCAGRATGRVFTAALLFAVVIPAPILVCCCRMALIDTGMFLLSAGGFVPASITVAVLTVPLIALNQAVLVGKAVRRPEVRFASAVGLPWSLRWRLILWHCRSYWWSELALLAVAFCEGSMLVERVFGIKGVGDAMYLACIKADPCLVVALVGVTAMLVNLGVVATSTLTTASNGKEDRK
jgi:ABC-type dipeptide/oligopeptide/nickel transport system permease component